MKLYGLLVVIPLAFALGCDKQKGIPVREINAGVKEDSAADDTVDERELGVAVYPGSATPKGLPPIARASVGGVASVECWRESSDSPEEIGAFYKVRLDAPAMTSSKAGITIDGLNSRGEKVRVIASRAAGASITAIVITVTRAEAKGN